MPERELAERLLLSSRLRRRRQLRRFAGREEAHDPFEEPVLESVAALSEELDELEALIDRGEEVAAGIPTREKYLRINHRLARRFDRGASRVGR